MSATARKAKGRQIRAWNLNRRSGTDLSGLAQGINPQVRGWINYYGAFYRSELYAIAARIDEHLVRWAMQKFKRLRGRPDRAWRWLDTAPRRQPTLFAHWHLLTSPTPGLREPYDGRPSRTVLREREGEAPSRYSPGSLASRH
jgi:RNA-directed DNA polymerase